jgi:hypothetical protein
MILSFVVELELTRIYVYPGAQDKKVVRLWEFLAQSQHIIGVLIGLGQVMTDKVWTLEKKPNLDGKNMSKIKIEIEVCNFNPNALSKRDRGPGFYKRHL